MCSENDRVVEVVDRVDDVDASLATLLSELIFGCTAAGAVNVELNKPKRPLPNAVDGIFGLFGLQICSLKLCGSVVDRFSAVFKRVNAGSWSARVRTLRKHAKLGCSYFSNDGVATAGQCVHPTRTRLGRSPSPHLSGRSKPPSCITPPPSGLKALG